MDDLPATTLFMLMSLDGKISTGLDDERDFDKDLPRIPGANQGLNQYYELERQTDPFYFNTGRVMAKVGWNEEKTDTKKAPFSFIIVDNRPHLTIRGVSNILKKVKTLYLVTTNSNHPATASTESNLEVIYIEGKIEFRDLFKTLKASGVDRITIQSGGEMNSLLVREGLVDLVSVVVAPLLVGGQDTPTLIDGTSLVTDAHLQFIKPLKLMSADVLKDSYLHLRYRVLL